MICSIHFKFKVNFKMTLEMTHLSLGYRKPRKKVPFHISNAIYLKLLMSLLRRSKKRKFKESFLPELDNSHIDNFFHNVIKHPDYHTCICRDEVPELPVTRLFCLINSQDSTYTGSNRHWTAIFLLDPKLAIIFDSYGCLPDDNIKNYVMKVAKKYHLRVVYQTARLQTFNSNACGYYCMFMILKLLGGETYKQALDHFVEQKRDSKVNEEYLYNYWKNELPLLTK